MSKFWDDDAVPVAQAQGQGFWDDDAVAVEANPRPQFTEVESGLMGALQGGTMGFADEIGGGVKGALNYLNDPVKQKGLGDHYRADRDKLRQHFDNAEADNPKSYLAGNVGGSVATAFVPGLGALNAAKGARAATVLGKGALQGAITGMGESKADATASFDGAVDVVQDGIGGAAIGAGTAGALKVGGAVYRGAKNALRPAKVTSVLFNAPEEAMQTYLENPNAVKNASSRHELTKKLLGNIDQLKREVTEGSQESRAILDSEGAKVSGSQIADILDKRADELMQRAEGVLDDPELASAYKWLKDTAKKYRPETIEGKVETSSILGPTGRAMTREIPEEVVDRQFSTNRVKDTLQGIDRQVDYEVSPGRFGRVNEGVKKDVRRNVDSLLKSTSPEYAKQMEKVSADTALLSDVSELAGTPQAYENLIKRVQRDRAMFPAEKLKSLDERLGTNLMGEMKASLAKEALDRGATNGSRNVNLYKEVVGDWASRNNIPFGRSLGAILGGTVDKYGPKMGKTYVDGYRKVEDLMASNAAQVLGKFAAPLAKALKEGNQSLAVTHYILMQDPEYSNLVGDL